MNVYILIDVLNFSRSQVYTGKTQIAQYLNISRSTLNKHIQENKILNNHFIVESNIIKQNKQGNILR